MSNAICMFSSTEKSNQQKICGTGKKNVKKHKKKTKKKQKLHNENKRVQTFLITKTHKLNQMFVYWVYIAHRKELNNTHLFFVLTNIVSFWQVSFYSLPENLMETHWRKKQKRKKNNNNKKTKTVRCIKVLLILWLLLLLFGSWMSRLWFDKIMWK